MRGEKKSSKGRRPAASESTRVWQIVRGIVIPARRLREFTKHRLGFGQAADVDARISRCRCASSA